MSRMETRSLALLNKGLHASVNPTSGHGFSYLWGTLAPSPTTRLSPVFRTNEAHRQQSIFGSEQLLPSTYQERLRSSWSHAFRKEVFERIDETIFAVLYSAEASRPNAPINIIFGAELPKAGFGWTNLQLAEQVTFNLQVRHALGLDDLAMKVPEFRTIYNWRRRVREYAEATGENLFQRACEQVTDEQLEALEIKTEWQRVDSTQILSKLAEVSRLELVISVMQKLWRSLSAEDRAPWEAAAGPYVSQRPDQICYGIKAAYTHEHLHDLGHLLLDWAKREDLFDEDESRLVERVLSEQYSVSSDGEKEFLLLRWDSEIGADSLQSPYDEEATYRINGGKGYHGGYVAGVSETCDPENDLQLITDVQVAPNTTDDATLLEAVNSDGGYTGPRAEAACAKHDVERRWTIADRATRMRGVESRSEELGWEAYEWCFDEDGEPVAVRCPRRKEATLKKGAKEIASSRGVTEAPAKGVRCWVVAAGSSSAPWGRASR